MSHRLTLLLLGAAALCACSPPPALTPNDAGSASDSGSLADAGEGDAGQEVDAGTPLDAGEAADAGDTLDAGAADPYDAGWFEVHPSQPYWKPVFEDDFKGKTGAPDDTYCYDDLQPQCTIWAGSQTNDCGLDDENADIFPPARANLVAALTLANPTTDYSSKSDAEIKALYTQLVDDRWRNINKCTWSSYEMLNGMATDYSGHYSSRFDPTMVTVDTSGRGHLLLSAAYAPPHCVFGGSYGAPNCQVVSLPTQLVPTVHYWVDTNPGSSGVYYAPTGGQCPHGGTVTGTNCLVYSFSPGQVDPAVTYWVDNGTQWPGVYYADSTATALACRDNISYPNGGVVFNKLACPILDGGILSMTAPNRGWTNPATGAVQSRGQVQKYGRFEVKLRLPKGLGAFPAAWLMPTSGGWPFDGGEIDILEARDAANEVYQTFHHGRCVNPTSGQVLDAADPGACQAMGGLPVHLSRGYTVPQVQADEFSKRDHLFAAEWDDTGIRFYVNGVESGSIGVGTAATPDPADAPVTPAFDAANLPLNPFYWILNHSTYVPPAAQASWPSQTLRIDYVKSYRQCRYNAELCPCGGTFTEGKGCVWQGGRPLQCPAGVALPPLDVDTYQPFCAPATGRCISGGTYSNGRCIVQTFPAGTFPSTETYWVDPDPRWPGIFYARGNDGCPAGGVGTVNCQVYSFPAGFLDDGGVEYGLDNNYAHPNVYYLPDFSP